ncbi:hypothetical protein EYS14_19065 [Alteromonadaceae bacterium M269]|nr:hypothetical protein EYS14_19065 [Alteromonadaceae bacterium M269]
MTDRNPLIEATPEDTLLNIHSVLTLIQELHGNPDFSSMPNSRIGHCGLALILKCTNEALNYEIGRLEKLPERTVIFEA